MEALGYLVTLKELEEELKARLIYPPELDELINKLSVTR